MAQAALAAMAVGTVLNAAGQVQSGQAARAAGIAQQQAADYQAQELTQQAGQTRAVAEQASINQRTNAAYVLSKVRANAAASGSATDPTAVDVAGQVGARGEYNALSEIYTGEEKARGLENQSALDIYTGQQEAEAGKYKQQAANLGALSSVLSGGGNLASKYGDAGGFGSSSSSSGAIDSGSWD